jgi:tetratricopeptide (TPR) repeat protein
MLVTTLTNRLRLDIIMAACCTLLSMCLLSLPTAAHAAATSSSYSIVLASAAGTNLKWEPRESPLFDGHTFYVEKTTVKGKPWERLCLGFFSPRKDATSILKEVQQVYPGAWIQKVSKKNIVRTVDNPVGATTALAAALPVTLLTAGSVQGKAAPNKTKPENKSSLSDKQLDSLMQRAKTDFKAKKYSSSIRYLKALIAAGENQYSQEALELQGQARQRKGQNTHAINTYEKYLTLYPDSDGSDRVRQRLAGLLTATKAPEKELRMSTIKDKNEIKTYGSFSQFYQSISTSVDDVDDIDTLSQLISYLDVTTTQKTTRFDHRYQFTSDHVYDFTDSTNSDDKSEFRFIEAYYEASYRKTGTSGRIGRQRILVGGFLKRFDGISAGYQFNPDMRLNVLGGVPVDFDNKTSFNSHKTFYGVTFETGTFLNNWSMNLFYFDQKNDGLTDFNSLGTEVRYSDGRNLVYGLIDYDLFYSKINILQVNTVIAFNHGRTAYLNAFLRQTPLLSTDNALIGRSEQSIEELKKVLNIEQIYQLARDRTANSETVTVGGTQQLNEKFQVISDITFTHIEDTVASGGVAATVDTGTDYFFTAQLVGNNLLMKYDTTVLGLRYYDTNLTNITSFIANTRFPITRNWRINPRLQYDIRKTSDGRSQNIIRALLRTDYRYLNKARFDFEIGYDDTSEDARGDSLGTSLANSNLFFTLGYRWDF